MFIAIANAIGRSGGSRSDGLTPSNTIAPVISGTATVGNVLTSTTGTWTSDTGITGYLYQWTRDGINIASATSSTYTLVTADLTKTILCKVAATDSDGTSTYVNSNSLVIYDADYKAILDKAISEGFTLPIDAEKLKQNQLVIDLKAAGAWAKADHILVLATNSNQSFARIDWRNPTHLATLVNAPTFVSKKGFQGGGTSCIDTNYNPFTEGVKYTQNNASRFIFMDTASGTSVLDGCGTTDRNLMIRNGISNQRINSNLTLTGGLVNFTSTRGMKSIHRTSSTNIELFNDTTQDSRTAISSTVVNSNQTILRSGSTVPIYGAHTISFYMMGESMVSENSAIVTAVNTYLNSL